jgi:hypothetical protein
VQGEVLVAQDEIDVELRTPVEVRARVLVLAALLRRLALENAPTDDVGDQLGDAFDEREWLRDQGLAGQLTTREEALLSSPPGALAPGVIVEASWQGEALIALAWAIRELDLPPVVTATDPRPIMDVVPRPWDAVHGWLNGGVMVTEAEAARYRELAEIWHWRAMTELLRREASPAEREDYEAAIREVAAEARVEGIVPALRDGDFNVGDRSVRELGDAEVDDLVAITGQRLRALNWLCGFGSSWDDVPFDV